MKKSINFLKRLSLVQQFIVIFIFVTALLVTVMVPLVDYNLRSIIDNQMYTKLMDEQDVIINGSYIPPRRIGNATHIIYDSGTNTVISSNTSSQRIRSFYYPIFQDELNMLIHSPLEMPFYQKKEYVNDTFYCIITNISQSQYLISIQDSAYSNELITSLRNQVVYIQYGFFLFFALVMALWILSLINPLKRIKNYIDMIKERKASSLTIDRKDEIGVVSNALVDMKSNLDKQEKIKEEMIHNISHDLKTPIALIKTYGQSVKDDVYPYGDKDSSMDVILENVDRLEHKVKSFLYLNRLDYMQGEIIEMGIFEMSQLIDKIVNQMDLLNLEIQLNTELEETMFVGDEEHWRVAIENIIENASRYAQSEILIILKKDYLEIYNDGEHIDDETLPFLFDPYVKGVKGQFGLGLSIVSKIASMFGYHVEAKNKEKGVSFIFTKNHSH